MSYGASGLLSGSTFTFMRLQLVSDLHLDFLSFKDQWKKLIDHIIQCNVIDEEGADVLVIAGDLAEIKNPVWIQALKLFADAYPYVVIVLGNHEHYKSTLQSVKKITKCLPYNVFLLDNDSVVINNTIIAGSTLWFSSSIPTKEIKHFSDFYAIPDLKSWVFDYHIKAKEFLLESCADVVITHHAPHSNSIHPDFAGHILNPFFISDCTDVINHVRPAVWFHGHTHHPFRYVVNATEVIANPFAYPRERYWSFDQYPSCFISI